MTQFLQLRVYGLQLRKGQTLLEMIFAIAVLSIGLFAVMALTFYNFTTADRALRQVEALNYAREGLEIVRNKRDTNIVATKSELGSLRRGELAFTTGSGRALFDTTQKTWSLEFIRGITLDHEKMRLWVKDGAAAALDDSCFADPNMCGARSTPFLRSIVVRDVLCFDTARGSYLTSGGSSCATNIDPAAGVAGMEVVVTVRWKDAGTGMRQIQIAERMYDW